jgi:hypothetical protein
LKIYWTCPYHKCTHKNETTSHLVDSLLHIHDHKSYILTSFKKEKKPTNNIKKLKKEVWDLFSEYVRRSEADSNGYCRCVSCGAIRHWSAGDAGHYIHGTSFSIPELVHFQCKECNGFKHGNLVMYKEYMINLYGEKMLDRLEFLAKHRHDYSVFELKKLKEMYQEKLRGLT